MDKKLEAKFDSQNQTQLVLEKYHSKFENIQVFEDGYKLLIGYVTKAKELSVQVASAPDKPASNKEVAKDQLITSVYKLSNALSVVARLQKDEKLLNQLVISESMLNNKMKDSELLNYSHFVQETVEKNPQAVMQCGVPEEVISDLKGDIDNYAAAKSETRQLVSERKTANEILCDVIGDAAELIRNQIDPLMELFTNDKEFYLEYKSARMIVNPAHRPRVSEE